MISITRRFEFDYGHRVLGHEGKCANLHGHRGVAEVTVVPVHVDEQNPGLDTLGRVIDFSVLKTIVGTWIDQYWDHNLLLNQSDPLIGMCYGEGETEDPKAVFGPKTPWVLYEMNPTAENLAVVLHIQVNELLAPYHLKCTNVRFHETPNCYADSKTSVTM